MISSQSYKICFLYFTNWLNAGALLQLAEPDWLNWSHDNYKDYILGLADRLYHTTKNPNQNGKPVSDIQNILKKVQKFAHKKGRLY